MCLFTEHMCRLTVCFEDFQVKNKEDTRLTFNAKNPPSKRVFVEYYGKERVFVTKHR